MDKATVYMWTERESVVTSVGRKRKCLSKKYPQKPHKQLTQLKHSALEGPLRAKQNPM